MEKGDKQKSKLNVKNVKKSRVKKVKKPKTKRTKKQPILKKQVIPIIPAPIIPAPITASSLPGNYQIQVKPPEVKPKRKYTKKQAVIIEPVVEPKVEVKRKGRPAKTNESKIVDILHRQITTPVETIINKIDDNKVVPLTRVDLEEVAKPKVKNTPVKNTMIEEVVKPKKRPYKRINISLKNTPTEYQLPSAKDKNEYVNELYEGFLNNQNMVSSTLMNNDDEQIKPKIVYENDNNIFQNQKDIVDNSNNILISQIDDEQKENINYDNYEEVFEPVLQNVEQGSITVMDEAIINDTPLKRRGRPKKLN